LSALLAFARATSASDGRLTVTWLEFSGFAAADRTGRGEGLGLGLSIVQAIADAHDAGIGTTPRPDGG
jgi:signal transduction histidine kinase